MSLLTGLFGVTLSLLVIAAALRMRTRLRGPLRPVPLDDEQIRAIEAGGRIEVDDELDPDEIEEAERRFLEEEEWE